MENDFCALDHDVCIHRYNSQRVKCYSGTIGTPVMESLVVKWSLSFPFKAIGGNNQGRSNSPMKMPGQVVSPFFPSCEILVSHEPHVKLGLHLQWVDRYYHLNALYGSCGNNEHL